MRATAMPSRPSLAISFDIVSLVCLFLLAGVVALRNGLATAVFFFGLFLFSAGLLLVIFRLKTQPSYIKSHKAEVMTSSEMKR